MNFSTICIKTAGCPREEPLEEIPVSSDEPEEGAYVSAETPTVKLPSRTHRAVHEAVSLSAKAALAFKVNELIKRRKWLFDMLPEINSAANSATPSVKETSSTHIGHPAIREAESMGVHRIIASKRTMQVDVYPKPLKPAAAEV